MGQVRRKKEGAPYDYHGFMCSKRKKEKREKQEKREREKKRKKQNKNFPMLICRV